VTSGAFVGDGTIPVGGIIMWSGSIANIPSGWALCDGQTVNGIGTPNLRDRFVVGAGGGYGVAGTGGSDLVTLSAAQMPSHAHSYKDGFLSLYGQIGNYPGGGWDPTRSTVGPVETVITPDNNSMLWRPMATDPAGGNQPFDNRPPYYALAYIMRVR
jgi:microcystin-dependent protein